MNQLHQNQLSVLPLSQPLRERVEEKLAETQPERETNSKGKRKKRKAGIKKRRKYSNIGLKILNLL
jgi:hypothetical protein